MEIIYADSCILVCIKPEGVLSTDEPGGLPSLLRTQLGDETAQLRTVHRLDRVVSGVMVLARTAQAASQLSAQVREKQFQKEYLAIVHGCTQQSDTLRDLLRRDPAERKTYVTQTPAKGVQEAILHYRTLGIADGLSCVRIRLETGRTHQIRAQFCARGLPLVGDRKYGLDGDDCGIALWSFALRFQHPVSGEMRTFCKLPPDVAPWNRFEIGTTQPFEAGE